MTIEDFLRYDGHEWRFTIDQREDGPWVMLSLPVRDNVAGPDALHALALTAVALDAMGAVNDESLEIPKE